MMKPPLCGAAAHCEQHVNNHSHNTTPARTMVRAHTTTSRNTCDVPDTDAMTVRATAAANTRTPACVAKARTHNDSAEKRLDRMFDGPTIY